MLARPPEVSNAVIARVSPDTSVTTDTAARSRVTNLPESPARHGFTAVSNLDSGQTSELSFSTIITPDAVDENSVSTINIEEHDVQDADVTLASMPAHAGAAWLDAEHPGWFWRIDLRTLDIGYPDYCILGQLGIDDDIERAWLADHGFWTPVGDPDDDDNYAARELAAYDALTAQWRALILVRRLDAERNDAPTRVARSQRPQPRSPVITVTGVDWARAERESLVDSGVV